VNQWWHLVLGRVRKIVKRSAWLRGHRHLAEVKDLRFGFNPRPPMPAISQPQIAKKSARHLHPAQ